MFNKVVLIGNLTRDIELRYLQNGTAVGKTAIAVTRRFNATNGEKREEACFIDIDFFGRTAEIANQYLRKGSKILVEGRLKFDQWQDAQTGANRSKHSVVVETMEMLGSNTPNGNNQNSYGNPNANTRPNSYQNPQNGYGNYGQNQGYGNSQNSYGNAQNYGNSYGNRPNSYQKPKEQKPDDYEEKIPDIDVDADKYDDGGDSTIPF